MRDKAKKVVNIICIVLSIVCIIATGVFGVLIAGSKTVEQAATELTNSQSLYLMQHTSDVSILKTIFGVYDDKSFLKAKSSTLIDDKVKEQFLKGDKYVGNYDSKPEVSINIVYYNPSASSLVARYYVTMSVVYENSVKDYEMIAEFVQGKLISLTVLP